MNNMNELLRTVLSLSDRDIDDLNDAIDILRNDITPVLKQRMYEGIITPLAYISAIKISKYGEETRYSPTEELYIDAENGRVYILPDGRFRLYADDAGVYGGAATEDGSYITYPRTWIEQVWMTIGSELGTTY